MNSWKEYVHFDQEMPFKERCKEAVWSLQVLQEHLLLLSEAELVRREKRNERTGFILANSSQKMRAKVASTLKETDAALAKAEEDLLKIIWGQGVNTTRLLLGTDATDFAMEVIKRMNRKNAE